jgi:glutathione S-transferase
MKLYITPTSPYSRLVRIVILEKKLSDRVAIQIAETRKPGSPYYDVNPSGRVPFLVCDDGTSFEDSQLIATYLDGLDGRPRLSNGALHQDRAYCRLEAYARSMVDGIAVRMREMRRPENERSPRLLDHEAARAERLADFWEREVTHPVMRGPLNLAQALLIIALDAGPLAHLGALERDRPKLSIWSRNIRQIPSVLDTLPPGLATV